MHYYIVAILLFAFLISVFAVQNAVPVEIRLLLWTFPRIPLVFVIFGTTLLGLIAGILLGRYSAKRKPPVDNKFINS
ncbi:MAG: lipopolysaccharide assembly protein LapA domain-containing protein [Thermacetogeniaceae bacterium]